MRPRIIKKEEKGNDDDGKLSYESQNSLTGIGATPRRGYVCKAKADFVQGIQVVGPGND